MEATTKTAPKSRARKVTKAPVKAKGIQKMSADHKAALAQGRTDDRAVRRYLEGLAANAPRRGRKRSPETVNKRLEAIEQQMTSADPLARLHLVQQRNDMLAALEATTAPIDLSGIEDDFVKVAKSYGDRKGISYSSWRSVGVSSGVLSRAGITRTHKA